MEIKDCVVQRACEDAESKSVPLQTYPRQQLAVAKDDIQTEENTQNEHGCYNEVTVDVP